MATPSGRRFVWGLVEAVSGDVFTGDALTTAHEDGKRMAAKALEAEVLRVDRRKFALMVVEWAKQLAEDETPPPPPADE